MRIIIDAMGGDNAPQEIVKGAALASNQYESNLVLVGDKEQIEKILSECEYNKDKIEIVDTKEVITMDDDPMCVIRDKKNSSMGLGLQMLKSDGDAFISAGSTGALMVGASLIIRTIKGVHRAGIATLLPFERPFLLLDSGANISVTSEYLEQWAIMGSIYMNKVLGVEKPETGLLNNGTEEHKGTQLQIETYQKLKENEKVAFAGNIESKDIPFGKCDVVVTDGFTGNITLKLVEGMAKFLFSRLKGMFVKNPITKLSYLAMKSELKGLKDDFDASEYGGAPFLGLRKPVIKAHGSSDAREILNSVRQAEAFIKSNVIGDIEEAMTAYTNKKEG